MPSLHPSLPRPPADNCQLPPKLVNYKSSRAHAQFMETMKIKNLVIAHNFVAIYIEK